MGKRRKRQFRSEVADDWALPDLAALVPTPSGVVSERIGEVTRYFDTDRLDLRSAGVTLVRCTGGVEPGWALSLPPGSKTPTLRVPAGRRGVPADLRSVVRGLAAASALRAIMTVRTERAVHRAYDGARTPTLTVVDERSTAAASHDPSAEISWREVTIVVRTADTSLYRAVRTRGRTGTRRPPSRDARLAPLLDGPLADQSPPDGSLGGLLRAHLSDQVDLVMRGDLLIRSGDLRPIHSVRVAIRRIRSVLRIFAAVLDPTSAALDQELAWYAQLLGAVRDLQVTRQRVGNALHDMPDGLPSTSVQTLLLATLEERAEAAREDLARGLTSRRCLTLLAQLRGFPETGLGGATTLPAAQVRHFLQAQRRSARTRLRKARRQGGHIATWHSARKAAKRTRYVAELAVPQLGKRARRTARQAKLVQDELGSVQDAALILDLLRTAGERAARAGDTTAVTLGALYARQQAVQGAAFTRAVDRLRL